VRSLKAASAHRPHEEGCYTIDFDDGGTAEIFGEDLSTGCMVAVRGITQDLVQFLTALLNAANWVMLPVLEEDLAIISSPEKKPEGLSGEAQLVVCNSPNELGKLLSGGFRAWKRYRDQVVGEEP
jgi:hypothetical protein